MKKKIMRVSVKLIEAKGLSFTALVLADELGE